MKKVLTATADISALFGSLDSLDLYISYSVPKYYYTHTYCQNGAFYWFDNFRGWTNKFYKFFSLLNIMPWNISKWIQFITEHKKKLVVWSTTMALFSSLGYLAQTCLTYYVCLFFVIWINYMYRKLFYFWVCFTEFDL